MKKIEQLAIDAAIYIDRKLPLIRKNIKRNLWDYVAIIIYLLVTIVSLPYGLYYWTYYALTCLVLMFRIVKRGDETAEVIKLLKFYEELSTSLLRERHGVQTIYDVKFETKYDKKDDIFRVVKRVEPEKK